ncbi:MAG: single-stranded DNA-binding protein [Deltaproteobacteria bacterium]|nr:single-stranded DNA-binding protein [Deltaproteobacteria bacterium]
MASLNRVMIMGRLGFDPEMRYTANQTPVASLRVATTEVWNRDGKRQEQTEWHRVVVWGRQAENCSKYLSKGRSVLIEGRLQTRAWDDKNGQKRYTTEIIANNVQFLADRGTSPSAPSFEDGEAERSPPRDYDGKFPQASADEFPPSHSPSEANGHGQFDDIPFMRLNEYGM